MHSCELAVSASGTTLLELCACGIPTICFSFADNQMAFAASMDNYGAMCYVGDAREEHNIERIICDADLQNWRDRKICEKGRPPA